MSDPATITVLNTPCVLTRRESLAADLADRCRNRDLAPLSVDFTNVHIVALRTMDPEFRRVTGNVDWFVSDSQILTWAIGLLGGKAHERIYGPSFLNYFFQAGPRGLRHFFLGGSQECLEKLIENLRRIQPDLELVGLRNGYFAPEEEEEIVGEINAAAPDIVWVGLGTPKQQEWIHRYKQRLNAGALLAVGFAFDVNAGTKKDAPAWLGPIGCTWLYRLACEPRRLWKRYLVFNTVFLWRLLVQLAAGPRRIN